LVESLEIQMAVLIKSVAALSEVTCNHDKLLTKLVDDHELRIRGLEKVCERYDSLIEKHVNMTKDIELLAAKVNRIEVDGSKVAEDAAKDGKALEKRVRALENWRWYTIGAVAVIVPASMYIVTRL